MTELLQDLRYALRQLMARPAFTGVAMLTIALGIGANTTIFSVVNGLLLRPLPYEDADRLVLPWRASESGSMLLTPDGELLEAWRGAGRSFAAIEAAISVQRTLEGGSEPRIVTTGVISAGFLPMLRVAPVLGRDFLPGDELAGAERVALLGHGFWRSAFGGRSDVIGESVVLDGERWTIIGVASARAALPSGSDRDPVLWLPMPRGENGLYEPRGIIALGRLVPGATIEQAEAELSAATARLVAEGDPMRVVRVRRPADMLGDSVKRSLVVLMGAVGLVLLVACANVANLLLARGGAREAELAVRTALGASRARLLRQLLAESALLAALGGTLGITLAFWGLDAVIAMRPESLRELERVRLDGRVLFFAGAATLLTGLLFGLLPALRGVNKALSGTLRSGATGVIGGRRSRRVSGFLIATEVALSLVLMIGAGLLIRTLSSLQDRPLGFDPTSAVTATVRLPTDRYPGSSPAHRQFHEQLRDAAAALPGVRAASLTLATPPGYGVLFAAFEIDGTAIAEGQASEIFWMNISEAGFFRTLDVGIVAGRAIEESDHGRTDVVMINETLARQFFPDGAVGRRVRFSREGEWSTVIGVAADLPASGLGAMGATPQIHRPPGPASQLGMLLLDTDLAPTVLRSALQQLVMSLDSGVAVDEVTTVEARIASSLARPRFNLVLLGALAAMALVLSAIGLYGVVSYAVTQRTREIGIRRALGAPVGDLVRLVLAEGLVPAAFGLSLGMAAAFGLASLMESMLYGLAPHDPLTFVVVPLMLLAVTVLACLLPARRAIRVEPVIALRTQL